MKHSCETQKQMSVWVTLLLASLTFGLCASCAPDTGTGSNGCAAPHIDIAQSSVSQGDVVAVQGENFIDGCADNAGNGTPASTQSPMSGVELTLTQGSNTVLELPVTIDADGTFTESVTLPDDLEQGTLIVTTNATGSNELELTVDD